MRKILPILLVSIFISSCSSKYSLQKRRYSKGFYFGSSSNKKSYSFKSSTDKAIKALIKNANNEFSKTETNKVEEEKNVSTQTITETLNENGSFSKVKNITNHRSEIQSQNFSFQKATLSKEDKGVPNVKKNFTKKRAGFFKTLTGVVFLIGGALILFYTIVLMVAFPTIYVFWYGVVIILVGLALAYLGYKLVT